jgi:hypothetical protein
VAAEPRSGFAEVNGARPYYESTEDGEPLVLVHAGIADRRMWGGSSPRSLADIGWSATT